MKAIKTGLQTIQYYVTHLINEAYESNAEIPTVPNYYLANPQPGR